MLSEAGAWAVVPAAGSSTRMGGLGSKCLLPLLGRPVAGWSLSALQACSGVSSVVLVVPPGEEGLYRSQVVEPCGFSKVRAVVAGAGTRQGSVARGLEAIPDAEGLVVVHDGARPLATAGLVSRVLEAARSHGAAAAAVPLSDTVKRADPGGRVLETLDRSGLFQVQTPQAFLLPLLREAHRRAAEAGLEATDDCALVEAAGADVVLVPGRPENLKVTTPEDLEAAAALLRSRPGAGGPAGPGFGPFGHRVGLGYDVHPLVPGRPLRLGGEEVPHDLGLMGHSDGDVLCHAICDALLGAAALGDIGGHFPASDPAWEGVAGCELLERVRALLAGAGFAPLQVDAVVVAESPYLKPYLARMRSRLAGCLGLSPGQVSVKATTSEGLGPLGEGKGICAWAVAVVGPLPGPGERGVGA
ncbi:MAG: 2-C-methyl-D-erythritol 4-phosphate cytidylyltransferase [Acetobacteraceae bacterium]|nr:2-C-methyl-D-erythritol 4-phosphate cytidylyltransferase [Acetobacteraceae bacterium]